MVASDSNRLSDNFYKILHSRMKAAPSSQSAVKVAGTTMGVIAQSSKLFGSNRNHIYVYALFRTTWSGIDVDRAIKSSCKRSTNHPTCFINVADLFLISHPRSKGLFKT